jgi:hypothetical protein
MATIFKSSKVWIVEFHYEGRPRIWYKALPQGQEAVPAMTALLADLYGPRAQLVSARPATEQEELDYVRGDIPKNQLCPTGRAPRSRRD